ncbi:hypothetical protein H4R19_001233 [Coemansia spiralis]|nr:hypothetical protein H4R19_001233 [Coemansia spiralis]
MASLSDPAPCRVYVEDDKYGVGFRFCRGLPTVLDRTLLCRAVFGAEPKVLRVCVPDAMGRTFNLALLANFANVFTRGDMPPPTTALHFERVRQSYEPLPFVLAAARDARMCHFRDSLLLRNAPGLFAEHFARYTVVRISMVMSANTTWGAFNRSLVSAVVTHTFMPWVRVLDSSPETAPEQSAHRQVLADLVAKWRGELKKDDDSWADHGDAAAAIFSDLAAHLYALFDAPLVVLIDNYDRPLISSEGEPWAAHARQSYLKLLRCAVFDNTRLLKAMLVGKYPLPLSDSDLDVRDMTTVEIAPGWPARIYTAAGPVVSEALGEIPAMFGFTPAEVCAVADQSGLMRFQGRHATAATSHRDILQYCFGPDAGSTGVRCTTANVAKFLQLSSKGNVAQTLRSHTRQEEMDVMTTRMIHERPLDIIRLVTALLHEYDSAAATSRPCRNRAYPCDVTTIDTPLGPVAISRKHKIPTANEALSMDRCLVHAVHCGRLGVSADNRLQIPSGRFRRLWEHVRLVATFGNTDPVDHSAKRTKLIAGLHRGQGQWLAKTLRLGASDLLHKDHGYTEGAARLEAACRFVVSYLELPRYLTGPTCSNLEYDHLFFAELHAGRSSWALTLHPFGRYIQRLALLLEFAPIPSATTTDEAAEALARHACNAITDSSRAQMFAHCDLRFDAGVAIGHGNVVVCHRFWHRVPAGCPVARSIGSIEEWESQPHMDDTQGWQDGLGWMITVDAANEEGEAGKDDE